MAWVKTVSEEEATEKIKAYYDVFRAPWGGVDNVVKVHSLTPEILKAHMKLYRTVMFGDLPLRRIQREMIGIVVSKVNNCEYCINHHSDALYRLTKNKEFVKRFRENYRSVELAPLDIKILEFAELLTLEPQGDFQNYIDDLRSEGIPDDTIITIVSIIAYFNFVNRIVQGLGVELEHYWNEEGFSEETLPMAHDPQLV